MTDADLLVAFLKGWNIPSRTENEMQSGVEFVLKEESIPFQREVPIAGGRIDFMVSPSIGLECKVDGSKNEVLRQLSRYAESEAIESLVLVTTKANHRQLDGIHLQGKPIRVVSIISLRSSR